MWSLSQSILLNSTHPSCVKTTQYPYDDRRRSKLQGIIWKRDMWDRQTREDVGKWHETLSCFSEQDEIKNLHMVYFWNFLFPTQELQSVMGCWHWIRGTTVWTRLCAFKRLGSTRGYCLSFPLARSRVCLSSEGSEAEEWWKSNPPGVGLNCPFLLLTAHRLPWMEKRKAHVGPEGLLPLSPSEVLKGINNSVGKPWLNRTSQFPLITSAGSLHTMRSKALCQPTAASGKHGGNLWGVLSGKALPCPRNCPSSQSAGSSACRRKYPSGFDFLLPLPSVLRTVETLSGAWLSNKHQCPGCSPSLGKETVSALWVT